MVKVNGVNPTTRSMRCKVCDAHMTRVDADLICPNAERKDHRGEPYDGRA